MECIIHIAVISNFTFEPFFVPLIKQYFGDKAVVCSIPLGEYMEFEYQKKIADADLIVVWLNLNTLFTTLFYNETEQDLNDIATLCKKLYANLTNVSQAKILWSTFEDYAMPLSAAVGHTYHAFADKLNLKLSNDFRNQIFFINLKHLIAEIGTFNAYDIKGKYRWNAPYSKTLIESVVREVHKQYLIEKGLTKKCLVLDCDNVLWGGIISEDGIENLKLGGSGFGLAYQDFQRFVLSLYYHGVILAICSKNDISDIMVVFHEHSEMILKEKHIACFQVNWDNKPSNIERIAKKLNISLDSIVFVDDSPLEVEAVKTTLPDVTAILFERDMEYEHFSCFNLKNNLRKEDVEKRHKTYQTNRYREELKTKCTDYADYIKALQIIIDIHEATPIEYSRISELTQRTNKCTNGRRYTVSEIKKHSISKTIKLYSVSVSDRFSDLGLVGAIEIEGNILTLFSLSCRALGRDVEREMLNFIREHHQINSIEYYFTGKNKAAKMFLAEAFPSVFLSGMGSE